MEFALPMSTAKSEKNTGHGLNAQFAVVPSILVEVFAIIFMNGLIMNLDPFHLLDLQVCSFLWEQISHVQEIRN